MSNDIGMFKTGLSPTERTSPTAKANETEAAEVTNIPTQEQVKAQKVADAKEAEAIAEEVVFGLNELVQDLHRELKFSIDSESGDMVIKVIDQETDEVVREIPSEEVVRLRKRLKEAEGVIFQGSA